LGVGKLSVSFWFKCKEAPAQLDGLFTNSTSENWVDGYGLYFNSATEVRFYVGHWDKNAASSRFDPTGWNHVVGMFDGARVQILVNGVEGKSLAPQVPVVASAGKTLIGRCWGPDGKYTFGGWLDEVRIYNRTLTPAEIEALARGKGRR